MTADPLPVTQLAHIEVAYDFVDAPAPLPAEEDVARRLDQLLAVDDSLAFVFDRRCVNVRGEHRLLCLFHLKEQRVVRVHTLHQNDPRASADAADTDYLACDFDQVELVEQQASIPLQRLAIRTHPVEHLFVDSFEVRTRRQLVDRNHQRRVVDDDAPPSVDYFGQLAEGLNAVPTLGFSNRRASNFPHSPLTAVEQIVETSGGVDMLDRNEPGPIQGLVRLPGTPTGPAGPGAHANHGRRAIRAVLSVALVCRVVFALRGWGYCCASGGSVRVVIETPFAEICVQCSSGDARRAEDDEHWVGVAIVVGTALSTFIAHALAEAIGRSARVGRPLTLSEHRAELRDSVPILSSAVLPSAFLTIGWLGWLDPVVGQVIAEATVILRIGSTAVIIERLRGEKTGRATYLTAIGLAVVATDAAVIKLRLTH